MGGKGIDMDCVSHVLDLFVSKTGRQGVIIVVSKQFVDGLKVKPSTSISSSVGFEHTKWNVPSFKPNSSNDFGLVRIIFRYVTDGNSFQDWI